MNWCLKRSSVFGLAVLSGLMTVSGKAQDAVTLDEALKGSQQTEKVDPYPDPDGGHRGIFQRSLFEIGQQGNRQIRIAFVLDGTKSMQRDLEGLKNNLGEILQAIQDRSGSNPNIGVAFVIYRDMKSPSGPVQILQPDEGDFFWPNDNVLKNFQQSPLAQKLRNAVRTEDGQPYFQEQVDRGIHAALDRLDWQTARDGQISRAVIVAGDAPPWSEAWMQAELNTQYDGLKDIREPMRAHSTQALRDLAQEKRVKIFSILCHSGFVGNAANDQLKAVAEKLRPELHDFLEELAAATDATVLDLHDPETARKVARGNVAEPVKLLELKPIARAHLDRRQAGEQVHVAVLPPLPLEEMDFLQSNAAFFALDLTNRLKEANASGVVNQSDVRRRWNDLDSKSRSKLIERLGVEMLIWGEYQKTYDGLEVQLHVYDAEGERLARTKTIEGVHIAEALQKTLPALIDALEQSSSPVAQKFRNVYWQTDSRKILQQDRVENPEAYEPLLTGYGKLEQATSYPQGSDEGKQLSREALRSLKKSLQKEPKNPLALALQSTAHYNLGEEQKAEEALKQAYANREKAASQAIRLEIEADHALFVEDDPAGAVKRYRELKESTPLKRSRPVLRANWMLAGLYLGDWGAAKAMEEIFPEKKDATEREIARRDEARECVLDILAYWPNSPEAKYYAEFVKPSLKEKRPGEASSEMVHEYEAHPFKDQYSLSVPATGRSHVAHAETEPVEPGS